MAPSKPLWRTIISYSGLMLVCLAAFVGADPVSLNIGGDPNMVIEEAPPTYWWPAAAVGGGGAAGAGAGRGAVVAAPYDLVVVAPHTAKRGGVVALRLYLTNTGRQASRDTRLSWWLTDPNGTVWDRGAQSLLVASGLTSLVRPVRLPEDAVLGGWTAHARVEPPDAEAAEAEDGFLVTRPWPLWWALLLILGALLVFVAYAVWGRRLARQNAEDDDEEPEAPPLPSTRP